MIRLLLLALALLLAHHSAHAQPLPGTKPLETKGDLARIMLDGIDKYLDREMAAADKNRQASWKIDLSSAESLTKSVEPQRQRLRKIYGIVDQRVPVSMAYVDTTTQPALLIETPEFKVFQVRWPVLPGVHGEGLLLEPKEKAIGCVVAIPDADQTPEDLVFTPDKASTTLGRFAADLAQRNCRVLVVTLINRQDTWSGSPAAKRVTNQPHREFVYRMAYQMGRHPVGFEVQKVLAGVDWFARDKDHPPIGVYGHGEGGLVAWVAGAVDTRIHTTCVGGYAGPHTKITGEPIYRNAWGLVKDFGATEMAALVAPRSLILEQSAPPQVKGPPAPRDGRGGAAPGSLGQFARIDSDSDKWNPFMAIWKPFDKGPGSVSASYGPDGAIGFSATPVVNSLLNRKPQLSKSPGTRVNRPKELVIDTSPRQKRQFDEVVDYTQKMLPESARRRDAFVWSKLDTSSLAKYEKSTQPLREHFLNEIIGKLPEPTKPLNPRTRLVYDTPKWKGYEVVLDIYDDVISYGILLVPNDIKPGEKRPCVVCQHGLEGRPTDVCDPTKKTPYYNSFGADLANKGFIVFAPQNPYIFKNDFRQVVRKANPLQLTLYAFIVRQHEVILNFLETLPFVDATRIAYYGLSYGGKVAMRIPALIGRYCLSICSGDFNEWIWKNINLDWVGSYMFSPEYEMYEFDLGNTFNYAEMAALIAPRPFMVERGHSDGVGLDEYVAFEYAKVRRLYAKLGIADRTEIEFFTGGHEIHLTGTLAFLRKHLNWPQ